jgi:phosphoribosylformimino-5-aminoimidazole carboxamide ribotide isomerase
MEIIPVVDLKGGTVVHARMGERERYQPLQSRLAPSSDPIDVVHGLLSIYPFASLYVADLDAIAGAGDNGVALQRLKQAFPDIALWLDSGVADLARAEDWLRRGLGHLVLGSETQTDTEIVTHFAAHPRVVLSLDFRGTRFLGPPPLLSQAAAWPQRVIAMTLDRVGSDAGPDLERLRAIRAAGGERAIYAAGGVRNFSDLRTLAHAGIAGALVASSLHSGRITAIDIERVA